jgi:hypothetical protein
MATEPASSLHRLLETRLSQLSAEMEMLFAETRERARGELAEQLNQAVRRLRLCEDREELAATGVDVASAFSGAAAWFRIEDDTARGERIRGVTEDATDAFVSLSVPLSSAAALAGAVETRDPVTAATSASEVGQATVELLKHSSDGRVAIYPIASGDRVPALLYTWGSGSGAALELISQVAAAVWTALEPPPPAPVPLPPAERAPELVQIEAPRPSKPSWDEMPAEEQRIHLRAQRFARVQIAEMRLQEAAAIQSGRSKRNLYEVLRKPIDTARTRFDETFFRGCPSMVDYLHLELVHTLAQDDAELLGNDYPGPLA